jgi:hypothetical protein
LLYFSGQNCGFRFELLYSERKGQKQHYRKYSTFLELNCQSILLGRYNNPLPPPSFPFPI